MAERVTLPPPVFWGIVLMAIAAGLVTLPSVGSLLILYGVLLAALAPLRDQPRSFWPLVVGLTVLAVGYLLFAPAGCTVGAVSEIGGTQETAHFCESLAGIDYEWQGTEDPSQLPAFAGAFATGLLAAGLTRVLMRTHGERDDLVEAELSEPDVQ